MFTLFTSTNHLHGNQVVFKLASVICQQKIGFHVTVISGSQYNELTITNQDDKMQRHFSKEILKTSDSLVMKSYELPYRKQNFIQLLTGNAHFLIVKNYQLKYSIQQETILKPIVKLVNQNKILANFVCFTFGAIKMSKIKRSNQQRQSSTFQQTLPSFQNHTQIHISG